MSKRYGKNILAIESSWDGVFMEPKTSMKPLLTFLTEIHGTKFSYNFCYSPTELKYILNNVPTKPFSLLYFALHGKPEKIIMGQHQEFEITLDDLANMMGNRFVGYGVHFASCAILSSWEDSLRSFMNRTGVAFISGYSFYVDFAESSLVDLALINKWMFARNYKRMFKKMQKSYKGILLENGFEYMI